LHPFFRQIITVSNHGRSPRRAARAFYAPPCLLLFPIHAIETEFFHSRQEYPTENSIWLAGLLAVQRKNSVSHPCCLGLDGHKKHPCPTEL
jgi:hypothetical protein